MSQFKTVLDSVIVSAMSKLPHGAALESIAITPDKKGVEVVWSHPDFKTGYLTPFEWTEAQLEAQQLPQGVNIPAPVLSNKPIEPTTTVPPALPLKVDKAPLKSVKRR